MERTRPVLLAEFMLCSPWACEKEALESTTGIGDIAENSTSTVERETGVE